VGLNYQRVQLTGMAMIAIISGVVIVVIGVLPFLGLIVPNIVSMIFGDNLRRTVPWVALLGALLVISCDIIGRLIIYPFEVLSDGTAGWNYARCSFQCHDDLFGDAV